MILKKMHPNTWPKILVVLSLWLGGSLGLLSDTQGQIIHRRTGEIVAARQATVNGINALSGLTVFSENQIKTVAEGTAIVNLGTQGRIELGAATDFTLQLADNRVGGELRNGRVVLSAPLGTAVAIVSLKRRIVTNGQSPTILSVVIADDEVLVTSYQGEAQIISAEKTENVARGEEVLLNAQTSQSPRRRAINLPEADPAGNPDPAANAAVAPQPPSQDTPVWRRRRTVAAFGLMGASLIYSLFRLTETRTAPVFDSTLTNSTLFSSLVEAQSV